MAIRSILGVLNYLQVYRIIIVAFVGDIYIRLYAHLMNANTFSYPVKSGMRLANTRLFVYMHNFKNNLKIVPYCIIM